jgi:DNA polymerase-3 subunit delta
VGELADLLRKGGLAGTILVISAPKLDKRQSLYRVCAELGEVQEFTIPEKAYLAEREATNRLNGIMGELGLNMDGDAAAAFLERTGIETRQMVCEAEKMKTYLGGRRNVELADVKAVAVFSREAQAWDLADAMGEKDLARALGLVRQLLFQASKESFPGLLMTLENRIRELMIYREAMDRGWLVDQGGGVGSGRKTGVEWKKLPEDVDGLMSRRLGKDPRQTHPYRAGLLARQAKRFSMPELRRNQRRVMETYEQLVSGQAQASTAIEVLLIGMLGKKRS